MDPVPATVLALVTARAPVAPGLALVAPGPVVLAAAPAAVLVAAGPVVAAASKP
jgi:hypothetical protein